MPVGSSGPQISQLWLFILCLCRDHPVPPNEIVFLEPATLSLQGHGCCLVGALLIFLERHLSPQTLPKQLLACPGLSLHALVHNCLRVVKPGVWETNLTEAHATDTPHSLCLHSGRRCWKVCRKVSK